MNCGTCTSLRKLLELFRAEVQKMSEEEKRKVREEILASFQKQKASLQKKRGWVN